MGMLQYKLPLIAIVAA